ncbi:MAG: hypothetical protein ACI93R_002586 [Flavobacteriales bacterium]|jgi:hypothetical protein
MYRLRIRFLLVPPPQLAPIISSLAIGPGRFSRFWSAISTSDGKFAIIARMYGRLSGSGSVVAILTSVLSPITYHLSPISKSAKV